MADHLGGGRRHRDRGRRRGHRASGAGRCGEARLNGGLDLPGPWLPGLLTALLAVVGWFISGEGRRF